MSWVSPTQERDPATQQPSQAVLLLGEERVPTGKAVLETCRLSFTPAAEEAAVVPLEELRDLGMASLQITVSITSLQVRFETGPGEAEHRLLFEGGSKHGGTEREGALQCYESEKVGRKESTGGADFYSYILQ